jgi:hypothetical protein
MSASLGEQWAAAFAAKDQDALSSLLADSIDFRGLTPGRYWEAKTRGELVDEIILRYWLEPSDHVTELVSVATGQVGDREHVAYRFRFENPGGSFIAEQQAYFAVTNGKIDWLRILCSGGIPDGQATAGSNERALGGACLLPQRPPVEPRPEL